MARSFVVLIACTALLMTGCEPAPVYNPPPEPTIEPFFPEEGDALKAVDEFMGNYLAAKNAFLRSGGTDKALADYVSEEWLDHERQDARVLVDRGVTLVGNHKYSHLEIQQWNQDSATEAFVQAYVCLDYRDSHYVGADGTVIEGEFTTAPFEAIMFAGSGHQLKLHELRPWTGRDFCVAQP